LRKQVAVPWIKSELEWKLQLTIVSRKFTVGYNIAKMVCVTSNKGFEKLTK